MKALCKGCEEADEGGALHQWIDPLLRWLRLHRRRRGKGLQPLVEVMVGRGSGVGKI